MSDKQKIKQLLQTGQKESQVLAIQLMCGLNWLLDDCALFCFLNIKPKVFKNETKEYWKQSIYKIGNYEIVFDRESKNKNNWSSFKINSELPKDKDHNYYCTLSRRFDNLIAGETYSITYILTGKYPMELNPPVLKYFGAAILLNLE